jgi:glycerophosphoryl diester phosphodiesterase
MKKSKLLWSIVTISILYILTLFYTDYKLEDRDFTKAYDNCHKIWSARGLYDLEGVEQNSLESLGRAFNLGAFGAEIDLHYDVKMKRFIISHDHPIKKDNGDLIYTRKNGELLTLENVFKEFGDNHYFWLDYKNLGHLSFDDTKDAIYRLNEITKDNNLKSRVYIEGTHPFKLAEYSQRGFQTIFDIQPLSDSSITTTLVINLYKAFYARGNFSVIAMHYGKEDNPTYGKKTAELLGDIPVFLYHIPDKKEILDTLLDNPQVRVMLVGRDINLNRFNMTHCKE